MQWRQEKQAQAHRVMRRMRYNRQGQAWRAWRGKIARSKRSREQKFRAVRLLQHALAAKAYHSWVDYLAWKHEKRRIIERCAPSKASTTRPVLRPAVRTQPCWGAATAAVSLDIRQLSQERVNACRWKRPVYAQVFRAWLDMVAWQQDMRVKMKKAAGRMCNIQMAAAFAGWARHTRKVKQNSKARQMDDAQVCCMHRNIAASGVYGRAATAPLMDRHTNSLIRSDQVAKGRCR
jgi:hypothetical protein